MKTIIIISILVLSSCASLKGEVFDNIDIGDTSNHVKEVLGNPDEFRPSTTIPGAMAWIYYRRGDVCGFTISDETVIKRACVKNPNYVNPIAAMLKGMGDGLKNNSQQQSAQIAQPINCTSSVIGNQVYTNCN